jgi:TonB family protein
MRLSIFGLIAIVGMCVEALADDVSAEQKTPRAPTERIWNCDAWYPANAPENVVTLLTVQIAASGDVQDASLLRSSGDPVLDKAALACAKHVYVRVRPASGQPVDFTWQLEFHSWDRGHTHFIVPRTPQLFCHYPPIAVRLAQTGTVNVSYIIGKDGHVHNVVVTSSSGSPILDQATVDCASAWQFPVATAAGQPIELADQFVEVWKLR